MNRNKYMYKQVNKLGLKKKTTTKRRLLQEKSEDEKYPSPKHISRKRASRLSNYSESLVNTSDIERAISHQSHLMIPKRTKKPQANYKPKKPRLTSEVMSLSSQNLTNNPVQPVTQSSIPSMCLLIVYIYFFVVSFNQNPVYNYTPNNNNLLYIIHMTIVMSIGNRVIWLIIIYCDCFHLIIWFNIKKCYGVVLLFWT